MKGWAGLVAAIALGVAAFPPLDWGPLGFLALWPWCWLVRRYRGGRLFGMGYLGGWGILGLGCAWLGKSSLTNLLAACAIESLYFGLFALALRFLHVQRGISCAWALPVTWVSMEFARSHIPLDGYPWLLLGYTQYRWLELLQISDLVGVFGMSWLLAWSAGTLDHVVVSRGRAPRARWLPLAAFGTALACAWGYGSWRLSASLPLTPGPEMLLVQASIPQQLKSQNSSMEAILDDHLRLTREGLEESKARIVVWPETMFPPLPREYQTTRGTRIGTLLEDSVFRNPNTRLLAGVLTMQLDPERPGGRQRWNSALWFDAAGDVLAVYDKCVLVPGGEYIPLIQWLPAGMRRWIQEWVVDMAGFLPDLEQGEGPVLFHHEDESGRTALGVTICYEIAYPHFGRQVVKAGAEVLVNLSNEAWFPDSAEFAQYTAMAAFRAAEVKRSVVRSANSGTSAFIDPWGRVSPLRGTDGALHGFPGTLAGIPAKSEEQTLYLRFGDWVAWLAWVLLLEGAVRRRKPPVTDPIGKGI